MIGQGPDDIKDPILLNGSTNPAGGTWRRGERHRLRLVCITAVRTVNVRLLLDGDRPAIWRPLAKDGADLPEALTVPAPAEVTIAAGETYDFEYLAEAPVRLCLEAGAIREGSIATQAAIAAAP